MSYKALLVGITFFIQFSFSHAKVTPSNNLFLSVQSHSSTSQVISNSELRDLLTNEAGTDLDPMAVNDLVRGGDDQLAWQGNDLDLYKGNGKGSCDEAKRRYQQCLQRQLYDQRISCFYWCKGN